MTNKEMAALALQHWRTNYPEIYARMKENGHLESEAAASARLTRREMDTLKLGGLTEAAAWEAARTIFIFSDPEKDYRL